MEPLWSGEHGQEPVLSEEHCAWFTALAIAVNLGFLFIAMQLE